MFNRAAKLENSWKNLEYPNKYEIAEIFATNSNKSVNWSSASAVISDYIIHSIKHIITNIWYCSFHNPWAVFFFFFFFFRFVLSHWTKSTQQTPHRNKQQTTVYPFKKRKKIEEFLCNIFVFHLSLFSSLTNFSSTISSEYFFFSFHKFFFCFSYFFFCYAYVFFVVVVESLLNCWNIFCCCCFYFVIFVIYNVQERKKMFFWVFFFFFQLKCSCFGIRF